MVESFVNGPARQDRTLLRIGVVLLLGATFTVVNLQPRWPWWTLRSFIPNDEGYYEHGWPFTYMLRDFPIANADMGGMYHAPWPFLGTAPLHSFRATWLAIDVIVALTLIVLVTAALDGWIRTKRLSFGLRHLLASMAVIGAVIAVCRQSGDRGLLLLALPNVVVIVSLVMSIATVGQFVGKRLRGPQNGIG